jgi:hypothetical protein
MRSFDWRRWFPFVIMFSLATLVTGWIAYGHRRSRTVRPLPSATATLIPAIDQAASPPSSIALAAPLEEPPAPSSSIRPNRTRERAHLLAWFISLAVIFNIASRILPASQNERLTSFAMWPGITSVVMLLSGLAALGVLWHKSFVWPRWLWRFVGLSIAALIALIAVQASFRGDDPIAIRYQTIPFWILAIGVALLSAWQPREARLEVEATPRWELIALLGILALAFALRVIDLGRLPYVLMGDESKFALQARLFNEGWLFQPFKTAIDGHWGLWFMVLGVFTRVFGETIEAIRLHAVIAGTLSVLATYAVARLLWNHRTGLIAAALLTTYHFHIQFSRNAMNNIYDALFTMLIFGLCWLGWLKERRWPWLLGALALGLAQYFYIGGRVILLEAAMLGLFWLITDRARVKTQALNITLAMGVFVVVALPSLYFAQARPDEYMTRFNQTNILRNGWLDAAMQAEQASALEILARQADDTIKVFVTGPEMLFYQGQSLLTPTMTVLVLGGLLYLLSHFKEGRAFWVLSSLGLIVIIGGVLTLSPLAGAHHFVGAAPLIYIASAVLIDRVLSWFDRHWPHHQRVLMAAAVIFIGVLMIKDAYYYFGTFADSRPTFSADAEPGMVLGEYLHELEQRPGDYAVLCVYAPHLWCSHDSVVFLAPRLSKQTHDLTEPLRDSDLIGLADQTLIVVVSPSVPEALASVQARWPAVAPRKFYGINSNLLFTAFEVPAAQR